MSGFYPGEIALHERLRRLAVEAVQCPLTLGDGLRRMAAGGDGYGVPLLLLSLPAVVPTPTSFGLKSLVGAVITLLGLQMFAGKHSVWLPSRFTRIRLRPEWSLRAARLGERFLPRFEHFVKPRMNWMRYRLGSSALVLAVIFLGLVMVLSIIPGTKILAAIVLLALSIGMMKVFGREGPGIFIATTANEAEVEAQK